MDLFLLEKGILISLCWDFDQFIINSLCVRRGEIIPEFFKRNIAQNSKIYNFINGVTRQSGIFISHGSYSRMGKLTGNDQPIMS